MLTLYLATRFSSSSSTTTTKTAILLLRTLIGKNNFNFCYPTPLIGFPFVRPILLIRHHHLRWHRPVKYCSCNPSISIEKKNNIKWWTLLNFEYFFILLLLRTVPSNFFSSQALYQCSFAYCIRAHQTNNTHKAFEAFALHLKWPYCVTSCRVFIWFTPPPSWILSHITQWYILTHIYSI